jgi:uncharacterized membrane protein YkoI
MKTAYSKGLAVFFLPAIFAAMPAFAKETPKPPVTKAQATKAAKAALPHGKILSTELEKENGTEIWSFDVQDSGKTKEVWVDAHTGVVTNIEIETPAKKLEEDRMDKAEAIMKKKTHGEVVGSSSVGTGKSKTYVYELKMKDGSTQTVHVDANTYKIIK